jgi:hypothetical protein
MSHNYPLTTPAMKFGYANMMRKRLRKEVQRAIDAIKDGAPGFALVILENAANAHDYCADLHAKELTTVSSVTVLS